VNATIWRQRVPNVVASAPPNRFPSTVMPILDFATTVTPSRTTSYASGSV